MSDSDFTIFKLKVGRASLDFVSLLLLILNYSLLLAPFGDCITVLLPEPNANEKYQYRRDCSAPRRLPKRSPGDPAW